MDSRRCRGDVRPRFLFSLAVIAVAVLVSVLVLNRRLSLPLPERGPLEMDVASSPEAQRAGTRQERVLPVRPASTGGGSAGAESGSDSAESRFIGVLRDAALPLKERRRAARALATSAAPEALEALREVLQEGPPELRAVIAEGLGLCPNPEARTLLQTLTESPDEAAARGATRGWGAVGTPEAAQVLGGLLQAADRPEAVRTEAALALGEMPGVGAAYVALTNAAWEVKSPAVLAAVLEGLGHRPIAETQPFFLEYLADPLVSADLRVAAVESIGNAPDDPSRLLLEYAMDSDPDVRAGAAWALSTTETPGDQGPALLELLRTEAEPDVRLRLYEALGNQAQLDAAAVLQLVQQEPRTEVRIAGLDLLAQSLERHPDPQLRAYFERTGVPALTETAVNGGSSFERVASVLALQRLASPKSVSALEEVLQRSADPKVLDAARHALSPNP